MLRALRALLHKVLLISLLCKAFSRLKRLLGIKASPSTEILPTSKARSEDAGREEEEGDGNEGGDWGSWDSREPLSIEVTGQKPQPQAKVYSTKVLKPPPDPEPVEPDVDFFGDMEPVIEKPIQRVRVKGRGVPAAGTANHGGGSRFAIKEDIPAPGADLENWEENEAPSAWDEDVLDDTEAEAISAEAKKQRREADKQRRQQEREQRRLQQEQKRQEQMQRKQLGMKIS